MLKKLFYIFCSILLTFVIFYGFTHVQIDLFVEGIENKTFDIRQSVLAKDRTPSDDIVIVTVDDASYEYCLDNIGEWPLPRGLYADVIEFIEAQNPKMIAFDMLFVKSAKNNSLQDKKLASAFKKYDNIYTALNFDYQPTDLRVAQDLPEKLELKLVDSSKDVSFENYSFTNYRPIIDEIIENTSNVGSVNISRSSDGVLRKIPVVVKYHEHFYPQLAFLLGYDLTDKNKNRNLVLDENSNILFSDRRIPVDNEGCAILNWYGAQGSYTEIPLYKIIKKINGEKVALDTNFNNKIVFIGMTANSLFDLKTTPTDKFFPGVEALATYTNNILNNDFIIKTSTGFTVLMSIILSLIIGLIIMKFASTALMVILTLSTYIIYIFITFYLMKHFNLWVEIVSPLVFATIALIAMLMVKYFIKSKDFEQQYKLATTDGLTGLYNHRYFQEQLINFIEHSKRYQTPLSLIIIDIDYFKRFNDNYGHQCGDRVLRLVAQTLKQNVRTTDIVCRYGGEEMSIILPNIAHEDAVFIAQKLCDAVKAAEINANNDKKVNVTISLGVSTFPQDGELPQDLIKSADDRLYKAKENGRNQVVG